MLQIFKIVLKHCKPLAITKNPECLKTGAAVTCKRVIRMVSQDLKKSASEIMVSYKICLPLHMAHKKSKFYQGSLCLCLENVQQPCPYN